MSHRKTALTGLAGLKVVELALVEALGWFPRVPLEPDYGIDLYVECAVNGIPDGRMIAMQIKSGTSYFAEATAEGVVFRSDRTHLDYWLAHALPVVIVLHNPDSRLTIWQVIAEDTIEKTAKRWKVVVPWTNILQETGSAMRDLAERDAYSLRLNTLRAARTWMDLLAAGGRVVVEAQEWINKSSGRGDITVRGLRASGKQVAARQWSILVGHLGYETALPMLFPWADLEVDEEAYDDAEESQWELEEGVYDKEEGRYIVYGESFEDWRASRGLVGLRSHSEDGEVAYWTVCLTLNDIGRAFIALDDYLSDAV